MNKWLIAFFIMLALVGIFFAVYAAFGDSGLFSEQPSMAVEVIAP